jgi:hypothetical protein
MMSSKVRARRRRARRRRRIYAALLLAALGVAAWVFFDIGGGGAFRGLIGGREPAGRIGRASQREPLTAAAPAVLVGLVAGMALGDHGGGSPARAQPGNDCNPAAGIQ